jgi:adenylyl-sulfate kinase
MKKESNRPFFTIWLTGLPCSGKTTISKALIERLNGDLSLNRGRRFISLDGDDLRSKLNSDLGFSPEDRKENLRRVGNLAQLFNEKELNVVCSFVSPTEDLRNTAIEHIDNVFLVFVECSANKCAERDVKGMWAKAKTGEIKMFTGYSAPYDIPQEPDLVLNTEESTLDECVDKLLEALTSSPT